MLSRPFGTSGLTVSALGFGAGHVGSPDMSEDEAGRLLNEVLDLGITFIDTAPGYGLSEDRIGRHLSHRRGEFVLGSKCGYGVEGIPDWTPEIIVRGVDRALRVMRTDYLDVMLFHSCPRHVLEHGGIVDALASTVRAGKVRVAGYSGENEDLAYAIGLSGLGAIETSVNVFDQRGLWHLLPGAVEGGMGVIAKRPLGNAPWRYADRPHGNYAETYWERMQAMGIDPGMPWDEFALRFTAFAPGVSTAIVGTSSFAHLQHNTELVTRGPLPEDVVGRVRAAFEHHDQGWIGQI